MRSLTCAVTRSYLTTAVSCLLFAGASAQAQSYYPQTTESSSWSGYAPVNPWSGYRGGTVWIPYQPGTSTTTVPPQGILIPGSVSAGRVVGGYPTTFIQPRYLNGTQVVDRSRLINGVTNPVPGPTPYADGRPHPYYEYGTGRMVPLAKPWLPGAPGGSIY